MQVSNPAFGHSLEYPPFSLLSVRAQRQCHQQPMQEDRSFRPPQVTLLERLRWPMSPSGIDPENDAARELA
jgi:hypothetical protein